MKASGTMIGQTVSHYRILSRIGEGGMGVVYVAEDTRLGRRVAIKFPLADSDESHYRARFLREARAVSALNHPNIASVYDFGETPEGQPYIVMELVAGHSLGDLLAQGTTLCRAVEIIQDVAAALGEAHRRGVIHRDIKPTNVLIGERDEVKVLDFGLAKHLDETPLDTDANGNGATHLHTRSDMVIGTPLYLSPEQARGARVDARSDLFALGALLYECAAGRPPFSGANVIEIGAQVIHVNPPPPSHSNPRVPPELDRVALKALAKKPEERFQSAAELIAALEPVRLRLAGNDAARTRRLPGLTDTARSSALVTLAYTLRRPRFSPLALAAAILAVLAGIWAYVYWRGPVAHVPTSDVRQLYDTGVAALRDGAYHRASVSLSEAVRRDDDFALARARLAEAWAEMDFLERAKDELLRVAALDRAALPEQDALYLDAIMATVRREHRAAAEVYRKIVERRPQATETLVDLARAQEKNDETEKAIASLTEATARDENYATAYLRLGALYGRQQNLAAAAAAFDRAEKLYAARDDREGRAEVLYQRGLLFNNTGRSAEARRELGQSLELARVAGNHYQQAQALLQLSVVARSENNHAQADEYASAAAEIAQTGGMPNLTARSLIALGSALFSRGEYDEAEKNYTRALELARSNRLRRYEAQALVNLGSLRLQQKRTEEGLALVEQARDYYRQGGYRKEVAQTALLLGRTRRQQGDYAGALQTLEEQLRLAEPGGDMQQLGDTQREIGTVHLVWGRYPDALRHLRESYSIFKSLGNPTNMAYALVKEADALWRLGRDGEARASLAEAMQLAGGPGGGDRNLLTYLYLVEAYAANSQRRFAEGGAKARQALVLGAQYKSMDSEATRAACVAALHTGARREGKALCAQALALAEESGDPRFVALAQVALAEALSETGDAGGALVAARRATEFFARSGMLDEEWQACGAVALAALRAGDAESARASARRADELLSLLRQGWGEEALAGFLARPDIAQLRTEVGGLASADAH